MQKRIKILLNSASEHYQEGDFQKALACYDEIIKIDPQHIEALIEKGILIIELGDIHGAISIYDRVLEIDPKSFHGFVNKAIALQLLEEYEEALQYYDRALEINQNSAQAMNNKAIILHILGKKKRFKSCLPKSISNRSTLLSWKSKNCGDGRYSITDLKYGNVAGGRFTLCLFFVKVKEFLMFCVLMLTQLFYILKALMADIAFGSVFIY